MHDNIAIDVKNLTKIYHLYDQPQDRLKEALNPFKKSYHHDFYAMHDVSFDIQKGDTVGIIGKNGAGKSTLLKMITGVLTPSAGKVVVNGKIASLLELGAGFNPEMSGMENIYLNGTLIGFTKEEMDTKVDAILEFADIGEFIHQPVKMYSSGMFARLAFSVAINVEPEILIVDEVLSVGDMRFQQKSLRKMQEMQARGITILFVTHDIASIIAFCSEVIWIDKGKVIAQGNTEDVSKRYIASMSYNMINTDTTDDVSIKTIPSKQSFTWTSSEGCESFGEGGGKILGVSLLDKHEKCITQMTKAQNVTLCIQCETFIDLYSVGLGIVLKDKLSNNIFTINSYMYDQPIELMQANSTYIIKIHFEFPYLGQGEYSLSVALSEGTQENHVQHHWVHDIYTIKYLSEDKTNDIAAILAFDKKSIQITEERLI